MLSIMLCGASDTEDISAAFAEVVAGFGGESWHYLSGNIRYLNNATASWKANSSRTLAGADICVFVVLRRYGEITWNTEMREALDSGKPFVVLCLDSTRAEYFALTRYVPTAAIDDPGKRLLVETLTELEAERQLTIASFSFNSFADICRRELAKLFDEALEALTARFQRQALMGLLGDPTKLTNRDLNALEELAVDEYEDKSRRKLAITALAARSAASTDTVRLLVSSEEQGVQRFAVANLAALYSPRPPEPTFMDDCVAIANGSDDTGIRRRLIPALLEIDVPTAVHALESLDMTEIGTRRRLIAALEDRESLLRSEVLVSIAVAIVDKCLAKTDDSGWLARGRTFLERLKSQ